MKKLFFALFVIMVATSACAPSPEIVATAMAQTQAALPTDTPLPPTATQTFTPVPPTNTPTETPTPTLTPTSTPDVRIILADPKDILCSEEDLPREGEYFVPPPTGYVYNDGSIHYTYFSSHNTNEKLGIANALTRKYIADRGRLDGWWVEYKKGNNNFAGISYIDCTVESFLGIDGARLAVEEYNLAETDAKFGWEYVKETQLEIGDQFAITVNPDYAKSGQYLYTYLAIDYSFRNFRVKISAVDKAWNKEINFDDLFYVAQQILKKLENAPLSDSSADSNIPGTPVAGTPGTLADSNLQRDVTGFIMTLVSAGDPNCQSPKVVGTEIIEAPTNGKWVERWKVDRCGVTLYFKVTFIPDSSGGTFFSVSPEQ